MTNNHLWKTDTPNKAGYYLATVLYDNSLGYIAGDYWDSQRGWVSHADNPGETVVGYIPMRDVLDAAQIEFPDVD